MAWGEIGEKFQKLHMYDTTYGQEGWSDLQVRGTYSS
jgi:hypothetical protein